MSPSYFSGKIANNDEALIDDLMHILKREVSSRRNKNTDILTLSSMICNKLSGRTLLISFCLTECPPQV